MANKAAFSREDVADAKRGAPAVSLAGYAADRGLQFLDHATPAGYRTAVPCDPAFQFNLMRGPLPGGEFGLVGHEAFGLPWVGGTVAWSGWVEAVGRPKGTGLRARDFALSMLPGADLFTGWGSEQVEPLRTPCTIAAVRLPESAGLQPHLRIDNRDAAPPYDFGNDVDLHALGLLLHADPAAPADLLDAFLAEPVASTLNAHAGDPLFQVLITCATLVVRRNGWIADPAQLDGLCGFASSLARNARTACRARLPRQPFAEALPPPAWQTGAAPARGFELEPHWQEWATATAGRFGLALEGAVAYHRAFPSVPVPGFAKVVMRGNAAGARRARPPRRPHRAGRLSRRRGRAGPRGRDQRSRRRPHRDRAAGAARGPRRPGRRLHGHELLGQRDGGRRRRPPGQRRLVLRGWL